MKLDGVVSLYEYLTYLFGAKFRPILTELLEVLIAQQEEDLEVDNQKRCSLDTSKITRPDIIFQTVSRISSLVTNKILKCFS